MHLDLVSRFLDLLSCLTDLFCFQEYELIRTEDIPHLENSKFDPLILRNVAENIIAFLQDKVAQEGHTYWLCHGKMPFFGRGESTFVNVRNMNESRE